MMYEVTHMVHTDSRYMYEAPQIERLLISTAKLSKPQPPEPITGK